VLTWVRGPLGPVVAFRHQLSANALVPNDAPLFAFETSAGGWAPMTKPWFMEKVSEVWKAAGLQYAPDGHGCRIGGASELCRGSHRTSRRLKGGGSRARLWSTGGGSRPSCQRLSRSSISLLDILWYRVLWLASPRNIIVESVLVGCHRDNSVWGSWSLKTDCG
jgi:hypothetical protein